MGITVIPTRHAQKPEAGVILVRDRILSARLYGPRPRSRFVICQDWEGSGDSLKEQGPAWLQCHHKTLWPPSVAFHLYTIQQAFLRALFLSRSHCFLWQTGRGKETPCQLIVGSAEVEFEASPLKPAYYRSATTGPRPASLCYATADMAVWFFSAGNSLKTETIVV